MFGMRDGYGKRERQAAEVSRMHDVFTSACVNAQKKTIVNITEEVSRTGG